ncbi:hypothetical protein M513_08340 [Trichuris suis]|uniref:Uncharacterized protein n=1 Tax=Trichuris suis TaxID=68888 RepID=A0A085M0Q3_9BILA|nr:hypothetical protein M513_08340 [Trichuris suis]
MWQCQYCTSVIPKGDLKVVLDRGRMTIVGSEPVSARSPTDPETKGSYDRISTSCSPTDTVVLTLERPRQNSGSKAMPSGESWRGPGGTGVKRVEKLCYKLSRRNPSPAETSHSFTL